MDSFHLKDLKSPVNRIESLILLFSGTKAKRDVRTYLRQYLRGKQNTIIGDRFV